MELNLCKSSLIKFHYTVASRWRIGADWSSWSSKRLAADSWLLTVNCSRSQQLKTRLKQFAACCSVGDRREVWKYLQDWKKSYKIQRLFFCFSHRFLYTTRSVSSSAFPLSRHGLSEWHQVALKDPHKWTLGTNNKPSFSLFFLSFFPPSVLLPLRSSPAVFGSLG